MIIGFMQERVFRAQPLGVQPKNEEAESPDSAVPE